ACLTGMEEVPARRGAAITRSPAGSVQHRPPPPDSCEAAMAWRPTHTPGSTEFHCGHWKYRLGSECLSQPDIAGKRKCRRTSPPPHHAPVEQMVEEKNWGRQGQAMNLLRFKPRDEVVKFAFHHSI